MGNPNAAANSSSPVLQFVVAAFLTLFLLAIFPHPILSEKHSKPFEFLQHLAGCHKGQTVKGLHELKQYLKKFGYQDLNTNHTHEHVDDDKFDELLESEIKTYQLNYHLKATGDLDAPTVKQMMMSRCGAPDIVNGTTSMRSNKKKNHVVVQSSSSSHLIHTVSHYSFFNGNPKWPASKTHLTYRFNSSVPTVISVKILRRVCKRAFSRWESVSHFRFKEAKAGDDEADIVIGFHKGDHGDGNTFDGSGGVLAHAFAPTNGRFHYDADEDWSTNPKPDMMDLETIALHEIGHLLGLGHSSVPGAIMYPTFAYGVKKRKLHGDDVQGIRALYGL
ncbi:Peptidase M10 [Macleaya cordata]|uniref:Peptidase M10 n=1 Tax=Macleaya cordata TaxID=56857 RepID=A0A200QV59_MACCD|nr:Peptidase M10 [Macleaya cordata]